MCGYIGSCQSDVNLSVVRILLNAGVKRRSNWADRWDVAREQKGGQALSPVVLPWDSEYVEIQTGPPGRTDICSDACLKGKTWATSGQCKKRQGSRPACLTGDDD